MAATKQEVPIKTNPIGGKISSTKLDPISVSSLATYKGASKSVGKKLEKQQSSQCLMSVENGRKTGGGKDFSLGSTAECVAIGAKADGNVAEVEVLNEPAPAARPAGAGGRTPTISESGGSVRSRKVRSANEQGNGDDEDDYSDDDDKKMTFGKRLKKIARKMGCGGSKVDAFDTPMPIVVFGATGTVGGAVARLLIQDPRFLVRAITRHPTTDEARALAEEGAVVMTADLNDTRSLQRAMEGAAGVFLTTNYWEHLNKQKEITHGMNAIDAAVSCNIHHFIFHGSEPAKQDEKPCGFMDAKAALEEYVKETTLPFTAVRFPFLYENLLALFKPHQVRPGVFTIPIPMEDAALDCMALHDVARCVINIFLRPKNNMQKAINLTGERMNVSHMAEVIKRHFDDRKIVYQKISPEDFGTFDFQGCQDIAALFENKQAASARDPRVTRRIIGSLTNLDKWTTEHKNKLIEVMGGRTEESAA